MRRQSNGLLSAAIGRGVKHKEVGLGGQGMTTYRGGKAVEIHTPDDLLIRVHETLHGLHSATAPRHGRVEMVTQLVEDMRLHSQHWPWPEGQTPKLIVRDAARLAKAERKEIAKAMAGKHSTEERGAAFSMTLRDHVVSRAIDGKSQPAPAWLDDAERKLFRACQMAVRRGDLRQVAHTIEAAYFEPPESEEGESGGERSEDGIDGGAGHDGGGPVAPKVHLDDDGSFVERCGDPANDWHVASRGSRIFRPALSKPVLPARMFQRRMPDLPGGATLIDASGSMQLSAEDLITIINDRPSATVALYSGDYGVGTIYVAARDGFRRSHDDIVEYLQSRDHGNAIDYEAIDWLMRQEGPRTMITDRQFCGESTSQAAIVKLANLERVGEIEVIEDGLTLLPSG